MQRLLLEWLHHVSVDGIKGHQLAIGSKSEDRPEVSGPAQHPSRIDKLCFLEDRFDSRVIAEQG